MKRVHLLGVVLVLGLGLTLALLAGMGKGAAVYAASFTVTNSADTNDGVCDADCTLREAIIAANATDGADTIILPAGTYSLRIAGTSENSAATGDLDITKPLTIIGAGAEQTVIDAAGIDRVLDVRPGAGMVSISGVTIIGGSTTENGGGIYCEGVTLTLASTVISNNLATSYGGGLYTFLSSVSLSGTQVISNVANDQGGGIYSTQSAVTLTLSLVSLNTSASAGAGILSYGPLMLSYSTLISNTAGGSGGGIFQSGTATTLVLDHSLVAANFAGNEAGGVFVAGGQWATIDNSTISANRTNGYGGGLNSRILTTVTHSTIAGNVANDDAVNEEHGGGIFAYLGGANVIIRHTIVADNVDRGNANYNDCYRYGTASVTSTGYNLVEAVGNCTFSSPGDVTAQDPQLGPLQDNGGASWTHALSEGSLALDAGDPAFAPPPAYDQRGPGFLRMTNGRIDIGAYEVQQGVYLPLVLRTG